jgi:tRNA modification GTPase
MQSGDTIAALATARGNAALAVIRVSGPDAIDIVGEHIDERSVFLDMDPWRLRRLRFVRRNSGELVDEVTAVKYTAPRSYTGENMVEIICHGGMVVVERILEQLADGGARYAGRGEFTRRAFLNGKTDLVRAEAVHELVVSQTVRGSKHAADMYGGAYRQVIGGWKAAVERILADIETAIEFGDEGSVTETELGSHAPAVASVRKNIEEEIQKWEAVRQWERGVDVVIAGPANAGKSTLLNCMVGYERALVHEKAGTTRDSVSEQVVLEGSEVRIIDTAGIRKTGDVVEGLGISKTREQLEGAGLVVWVTAADRRLEAEERMIIEERKRYGKIVAVINKSDLGRSEEKERYFEEAGIGWIGAAARRKEERMRVVSFVSSEIRSGGVQGVEGSVIASLRQERLARDITEELHRAERYAEGQEEFAAYHCRKAVDLFEEYVGKHATEEMLNGIFERFCIGK